MKKNAVVIFRIKSDLKEILIQYCIQNKFSISKYLTTITEDVLIKKKFTDTLSKALNIYSIKQNRRDLCSKLYITKNMYRRVMDMALSSYFTSRNVNMRAINAVLDSFVAEFENYDESIRSAVQIDFKLTVKRLRNKEFLLGQSQNFKMLKYVQK